MCYSFNVKCVSDQTLPPVPAKANPNTISQPGASLLRQCTKCKQEKPYDCFYPNKELKLGLHSWCKGCMIKATALRNKLNPELQLARQRKCYHSRQLREPGHAAKKSRKWRSDNPEKNKLLNRRQYPQRKKWASLNPSKIKSYSHTAVINLVPSYLKNIRIVLNDWTTPDDVIRNRITRKRTAPFLAALSTLKSMQTYVNQKAA